MDLEKERFRQEKGAAGDVEKEAQEQDRPYTLDAEKTSTAGADTSTTVTDAIAAEDAEVGTSLHEAQPAGGGRESTAEPTGSTSIQRSSHPGSEKEEIQVVTTEEREGARPEPARDDGPPPAFSEIDKDETIEAGPAAGEPEGPEKLPRGRMIIIVCSLCMCTLVAAMDQSILTTALPAITANFDSASGYTWIGSAYLLMSAAFLPSWGKFSDIFGRKPVLLTASAIFMIGSILCGAAQNIGMLIFGRAVQGLGAGGSFGMVNLTISDLVAPRERGFYLSFVGITWTIASCLGPVLGGAFTQEVNWRFCFWINIPIGGLAMIGLIIYLHLDSPRIPIMQGLKMVDWWGSFTSLTGTTLFLLSLELGGVYYSWSSPLVICLLLGGVGLLVAFVIVEWKFAVSPLMPLRLFQHKTAIACYLVNLCHGVVFIGATYFLPLFMQSVRGSSPLISGVMIFPYLVVSSVLSAGVGALISKTGKVREYIWIGMFLLTVGAGLLVDLDRKSNWAKLILYQIIIGAGTAPNFQSPLILIQCIVPIPDLGAATATYMFIRNIASALGVSLGMVVFQNGMSEEHRHLHEMLGAKAAEIISGKYASASVDYIHELPAGQRHIARDAYAAGIQDMWWFYLGVSAAGMVASAFIGEHTLSRQLASNQPAISKKKKKELKGKGGDTNV